VIEVTPDLEALQTELARTRALAQASERAAQTSAAVARALAELPADASEDDALPRVLEVLAGALGCTLAAYWAPGPGPAAAALECRVTWRANDAAVPWTAWDDASRRVLFPPGQGLPGLAWQDRAPVWLENPEAIRGAEPARLAALADAGIRSGVALPVIAAQEVLGVIELFALAPGHADARLDGALRAIGDHVGQLVRYARAQARGPAQPAEGEGEAEADERRTGVYQAADLPGEPPAGTPAEAPAGTSVGTLDEERETVLRLHEIGRTLNAELDPQALARSVAELSAQLAGAQRAALFYRIGTSSDDELRVATSGISQSELARLPMPRSTPLLGLAFNSREVLRVDDITADPRYGKNPPHHGVPTGHFPVRSYLAVPVRSRTGRVTGALFLAHERAAAFDARSQRLALGMAAHAAAALDSAALFADQQRLIDELEKTNAELDQFAYAASHDLREPLRGITNLAAWIEEDLGASAPKKVREHLAMLKGRAARMDRLIRGLLELARVGREREKPERIDVTELLHETIDLLSPPPASRILIIGAMPTLFAERYALQQVLLNLIANAIQHGGKSDVVVRITSTEHTDEVEISVADDGVGIPPELQAQCWIVFQTLQSRDVVDSPGIGLAIVKKQVESNGGRAWFVPRPKQGTDVRFTWRKRAR
jgi:signal transduction histidine kinase